MQDPARLPISSWPNDPEDVWCYQEFQKNHLLIYHTSGKPELSLLVETTPDKTWISYFSLYKGDLKFVKTEYRGIDPLPVPSSLQEVSKLEKTSLAPLRVEYPLTSSKGVEIFAQLFTLHQKSPPTIQNTPLREGVFEVYLPQSSLPFTGYWWPFENDDLYEENYSPLALYDKYVKEKTGQDPASRTWEKNNHSSYAAWWGGHCNGWAASTFLYREPRKTLWYAPKNIRFRPIDLKGILAEASFCVHQDFYGRRNNGAPTDVLEDISPERFHEVIEYYLKGLQKPVIFDKYRDEKVDNLIFTGYSMEIEKRGPNHYRIEAEMRVHEYNYWYSQDLGEADSDELDFEYDLFIDATGKPIRGVWRTSNNPDFLWVPVSQKDCGQENPQVKTQFVQEILSLPVRN